MNNNKKIVCIDFDGVIHSYTSGWKGAHETPDPPVPGAEEFLKQLLKSDKYEIFILSTRAEKYAGIEAIRFYLLNYCRITYDQIKRIYITDVKPKAHLIIDDRAFCFKGQFPTIEEIDSFKPWNK